jgi:hypothetical protein
MTMESYMKVMKETIDQLEVMQISVSEDLIVLLMLHSLPKEYQYFIRIQIGKDSLPTFNELESKLLDEEMQVKMDADKESAGEALYVKRAQQKKPWFGEKPRPQDSHLKYDKPKNDRYKSKDRNKEAKPKFKQDMRAQDEDRCNMYRGYRHWEHNWEIKKIVMQIKALDTKMQKLKHGGNSSKYPQANAVEKGK